MKTTREIPDAIFRRDKAKAAEQKIPLRRFVSNALAEKLEVKPPGDARTWLKLAGRLRCLRKQSSRFGRLIEREFEKIDSEDWRGLELILDTNALSAIAEGDTAATIRLVRRNSGSIPVSTVNPPCS